MDRLAAALIFNTPGHRLSGPMNQTLGSGRIMPRPPSIPRRCLDFLRPVLPIVGLFFVAFVTSCLAQSVGHILSYQKTEHGITGKTSEASFAVRAQSDSEVWSGNTLAAVAIWHAALGNLPSARDAVRRLLVNHDALECGTDWPSICYWDAAQVFRLDGDSEKARHALQRASELMEAHANILGPEDRERFLALPWHADLRQAVAAGTWPDPPR